MERTTEDNNDICSFISIRKLQSLGYNGVLIADYVLFP